MKKIAVLAFASLIFAGCQSASEQTQSTKNNSNVELVSSHSQATNSAPTPTPVPKSATKTKWTQSGNPIDTADYDKEIQKAETKLKNDPKNEQAKKSLAEAFLKRGNALTEARQYASAIGDYRRAAKLDPTNGEAKTWINEIVKIYDSINRTYPAEGEEPPPLPFKQS